MNTWAYDEPIYSRDGSTWNRKIILTEFEILESFYPNWSQLMFERGKLPLVTEQGCIDDWICVNWAYPYAQE